MTGSADAVPARRPRPARQHQPRHRARRFHAGRSRSATNSKHNEANGEDNRDGSDDNISTNCGVEGPTDDAGYLTHAAARCARNQLACLFLAQGVPLLLAGDEVGNTQNGNNNAYCQDNEIGWVDWSTLGTDDDLTDLRRPT